MDFGVFNDFLRELWPKVHLRLPHTCPSCTEQRAFTALLYGFASLESRTRCAVLIPLELAFELHAPE